MFTAPRRSIFARNSAMASSADIACCALASAAASMPTRWAVTPSPPRPAHRPSPQRRHGVASLVAGLVTLIVAVERGGVGNGRAIGLHLRDFGGHLVERQLQRVGAGRGEVRQVGLGGGASDVELTCLGARLVEVPPRDAHGTLARRKRGVERRDVGIDALDIGTQRPQARLAVLQLGLARDDRRFERGATLGAALTLARAIDEALFELTPAVFEPPDLVGKRQRALDQRGVGRLGL